MGVWVQSEEDMVEQTVQSLWKRNDIDVSRSKSVDISIVGSVTWFKQSTQSLVFHKEKIVRISSQVEPDCYYNLVLGF